MAYSTYLSLEVYPMFVTHLPPDYVPRSVMTASRSKLITEVSYIHPRLRSKTDRVGIIQSNTH